ncbi:MAG TPA: 5-(carboxyamino)imidazole ribonucleotide synthase [Fimbriiglobus sp.]|nr:5-(carboxyamino)imidazole ribonucleotide synthase [Fimbriiglobus sp.]
MRVGILGGGQLGRMIALAGYPLGVRCSVFDPASDPCAGQVCGHLHGEYDDYQALYQLARVSDVVTYEFENVPVESARWLAERVPVYPPPRALEVSQDRLTEKTFFEELGVPTPPFAAVDTREQYDAALREIGLPAVLKTRRFGYDGKGQAVIRTRQDAESAWNRLGGRPLILEGFVPFERELSVIAVRGRSGEVVCYPLIENEHRDGVLHRSVAPAAELREELTERAQEYVIQVMTELHYVGVLTIEWFQDGPRLLANEMAPRVHNSGHWTIEGAQTSQFENHLRAVCGWPLGRADAVGYSALFNFIGSVPATPRVLRHPVAHLHTYGKDPRPGRKVGHVTLRAATADELADELPDWSRTFDRKREAGA